MADLSAGSIAFTGYNADGSENLAFVTLQDIPAGTVIQFTDNNWSGTAFTTTESFWSWTATGDIAAGTVISMDSLGTTSPTSNLGTVNFSNNVARDIADANEVVYAYIGSPGQPTTFLTAVANSGFAASRGVLTNTGLVQGQTAVSLPASADIAAYTGPTSGFATMAEYLALINNSANWISQNATGDQSHDGTAPDVPFSTSPITIDPSAQPLSFTADSVSISKTEGNSGTTLFTFTVQRSNGTTGTVTFSGTFAAGTTDAADFGGTLPISFSGTIAEGAATGTVTIAVSGDQDLEIDERFTLTLTGGSNSAGTAVYLTGNKAASGTILNDDDSLTIHNGETRTSGVVLTGVSYLTVEAGGALSPTLDTPITWSGAGSTALIENFGVIQAPAFTSLSPATGVSGTLTLNNHVGAEFRGSVNVTGFSNGTNVVVNNDGLMLGLESIAYRASRTGGTSTSTINNSSTGIMTSTTANADIISWLANAVINNRGQIVSATDAPDSTGFLRTGGNAIDVNSGPNNTVHNFDGGVIIGSHHAVTGKIGVTVINDAGGVMLGRNGSAVNIDNDAAVANTVYVTNRGTMIGASAGYDDSDGDAIDTDGRLQLDNYGVVKGIGANGYHDGEVNVSEGVAIGGGVINNYADALIYGYGRAIQVDNSSNGPALAATTIYNEGEIWGDGHGPEGASAEDTAAMSAKIVGREAIDILGTFADTITNKGRILGGVFTDGGDDVLTNSGLMAATGGAAIDMGDGNDTLTNSGIVSGNVLMGAGDDTINVVTGSTISGTIDGGDGVDTLNLQGSGSGGTLGTISNVEKIDVQGGTWAIGDSTATITVESGANLIINGTIAGSTVAQGGAEYVYGSVSGSTVLGDQLIGAGGVATDTTITGGNQMVWGGADDTTVKDGGLQYVYGSVTDTTVGTGGQQNVYADGTATGTTVGAGGFQLDWGAAVDTTIDGGTQFVYGTAIGTSIVSGVQHIAAGATATATSIGSGGTEYVHSGGSAHDVTFAGPNATLVLDRASDFSGTISGWQFGDVIDFGDFDANTATVSYAENAAHTGGTLRLSDGTHHVSLALLGQYTASDFALASDGHGGTLLTDPTNGAQVQATLAPAHA